MELVEHDLPISFLPTVRVSGCSVRKSIKDDELSQTFKNYYNPDRNRYILHREIDKIKNKLKTQHSDTFLEITF